MRLLLDTHVWVWTQEDPGRLGPRTKRLVLGAEHENGVSPISTLEIARLIAAGEIQLSIALAEWVTRSMADLAAHTVAMDHDVAMEAYSLPGAFHRDPADRVLVATARRGGMTLVTADDRILSYPHVRAQDARR